MMRGTTSSSCGRCLSPSACWAWRRWSMELRFQPPVSLETFGRRSDGEPTSFFAPTHLPQHFTLRQTHLSLCLPIYLYIFMYVFFSRQVGDGNSDHQCWQRPEDMDTPRTLTKVTASSPGTEPAADAAAALASAAIVFKSSDANYSTLLLAKSRAVNLLAVIFFSREIHGKTSPS